MRLQLHVIAKRLVATWAFEVVDVGVRGHVFLECLGAGETTSTNGARLAIKPPVPPLVLLEPVLGLDFLVARWTLVLEQRRWWC